MPGPVHVADSQHPTTKGRETVYVWHKVDINTSRWILTMISLGQLKSVPSSHVASTSRTRNASYGCFTGQGVSGRLSNGASVPNGTGEAPWAIGGGGTDAGATAAAFTRSDERERVARSGIGSGKARGSVVAIIVRSVARTPLGSDSSSEVCSFSEV